MRLVRALSVLVALLCGAIVLLDYFITEPTLDAIGGALVNWVTILAAVAFVLGLFNLVRVHGGRIAQAKSGWPCS